MTSISSPILFCRSTTIHVSAMFILFGLSTIECLGAYLIVLLLPIDRQFQDV